ncbi:MAG: substrate-binding domain-containing protein [Acidobacteria bacterium]|nr:substrate-binding domain-containing protein [Acidobacteriota bacterium]
MTRRVGAALLALLCAAACSRHDGPIILATTSSVGNSGLLDAVLPAYASGTVRPVLVGSGRALDMLAGSSADVVISHAPARETAALAAHPDWSYRKILYNDFIIAGPAEDPARVRDAKGAVDAMMRIARSSAIFLSRGDESGTHERERALWATAAATPGDSRLVIAGAGMGQTLRIASSSGAYTLTDRGTFQALKGSIDLVVLHEGDPRLLNTYAVVWRPANRPGARFAGWLADGAGREVIAAALRDRRVTGFTTWPGGIDGTTPSARPR